MRLAIDDSSSIFSISVSDAALLLALEQGHYESTPFTDEETAPFIQDDKYTDEGSNHSYEVWRDIHNMLSISPLGNVKKARDELLRHLLSSIVTGELQAESVRRTLDGSIKAEQTFLDLAALEKWADERDFDLSSLWNEYGDAENELAESIASLISDRRDIWSSGGVLEKTDKAFDELPDKLKAEYLRLVQENLELRRQRETHVPEKPASPKLTNNLLKIIAVLLSEHYPRLLQTPYKVAAVIAEAAQRRGLSIGDDTIAARVKDSVALLPKGG